MDADRFIVGIYNYCDYWCERCAFTKRCRNFSMGRELEQKARGESPTDDATQQSFWNHLADQLREATVFGHAGDWADDHELDLDAIPDPAYEAREAAVQRAVDEHPLTTLAYTYMKKVDAWLKSSDDDLKTLAVELLAAAGNAFDDTDYEEQARQIGEMIDVVAWYHTLLPPKIARSIRSMVERDTNDHADAELAAILMESHEDDANGSGKLVLESIQRSAAAWVEMRKLMPHREDEIIEMLAILARLRRGIHEHMPGAKSFARPGLDESQ